MATKSVNSLSLLIALFASAIFSHSAIAQTTEECPPMQSDYQTCMEVCIGSMNTPGSPRTTKSDFEYCNDSCKELTRKAAKHS